MRTSISPNSSQNHIPSTWMSYISDSLQYILHIFLYPKNNQLCIKDTVMNYKSYSNNCKLRNTAHIFVFLEHIQIGIVGIQKGCILYSRFRNRYTFYRLKNSKRSIPNIHSMSCKFYNQSRKAHISMSPNKSQFCIRGIVKSCR